MGTFSMANCAKDRPIVIEDSVVPQQGMAFSQEPLCKKHRTDEVAAQPTLSSPSLRSLSFQQLSHYDDILTDVLVDRVSYHFTDKTNLK